MSDERSEFIEKYMKELSVVEKHQSIILRFFEKNYKSQLADEGCYKTYTLVKNVYIPKINYRKKMVVFNFYLKSDIENTNQIKTEMYDDFLEHFKIDLNDISSPIQLKLYQVKILEV